MQMTKSPRTGIATATVAALLALPGAAPAQSIVPPGNSAATQYTEAFPTAGGNRATGRATTREPAKALGRDGVRRLRSRGQAGEGVVALVAATAPESVAGGSERSQGGGGRRDGAPGNHRMPTGDGSSGISESLGQATGLSAGTSPLIPLTVLIAALWAAAYLWRRRHPA